MVLDHYSAKPPTRHLGNRAKHGPSTSRAPGTLCGEEDRPGQHLSPSLCPALPLGSTRGSTDTGLPCSAQPRCFIRKCGSLEPQTESSNDDRRTGGEANAEHCQLTRAGSGRSSLCPPKPYIFLLFLAFFSQNPLSFLTFKGSPAPAGKLAAFCSGTCCKRRLSGRSALQFLFQLQRSSLPPSQPPALPEPH